jgi:AP-1 complex subunit gamma-1
MSNSCSNIRTAISQYRSHIDVEIQQRAVEYSQLFALDRDTRFAFLEHMPVLGSALEEENLKGTGQPAPEQTKSQKPATVSLLGTETLLAVPGGQENIMDLLGGLNLGAQPVAANATVPKQATAVDLLGDLFGGGSSAPTIAPAVSSTSKVAMDPLADLLGVSSSSSNTFAPVTCYDKNGLVVTLQPLKESSIVTQFKATFTSQSEITNLLFQVAVPKVLNSSLDF